jgi:Ca2+-binding RTX toxin-like protein
VWTIDLTAPTTTLAAKPRARDWETTARFRLTAADAGGSTVAGYECRLDGGPFGACPAESEWRDLAEGSHTFEARAADAVGNVEDPAVSYTWTVRLLNAADDQATTRENTPVTIDVGANDVYPDPVTLAPDAASAAGGTVTVADGTSVTYAPAAGFNGTDTFRYSLTDAGDTVWGTVSVRVEAVDDAPSLVRAEEAIVVDEDSGPYRAPWADAGARFALQASRPELFSAAPAVEADGSLTFTPAPDAYGTATVTGGAAPLTITIRPVDDAPRVSVARDVRCGRSSNGTFRLNVVDIDGSNLRVSGTSSSKRVGLAFGRAGNSRTISITRKRGLRRATVTVRAVDGDHVFQTRVHLAVGTAGADRLRGTRGPDLLFGLGGDDQIAGRGGHDLICGGNGNDRLDGGAGNDVVIGGRGDDEVGGGDGNDVLRGDTGADRLTGGAGDDELRGGPRGDVFDAAPGNDRLVDFNARRGDVR